MLKFLAASSSRRLHQLGALPNVLSPLKPQGATTCLCRQISAQKNIQRTVYQSSQCLAKGKPSARSFEKDYPEDNVDKNHIVIYTSNFAKQIHWTYVGLSGMMVAVNGTAIFTMSSVMNAYSGETFDPDNPAIQIAMMCSLGMALVVMLQRLVKSSVLRVYYIESTDSYVGVTKNTFLQNVKFPFKLEDITWKKPGIGGNFFINGRAVHLQEAQFKSSIHYKALYNQAMLSKPSEQ